MITFFLSGKRTDHRKLHSDKFCRHRVKRFFRSKAKAGPNDVKKVFCFALSFRVINGLYKIHSFRDTPAIKGKKLDILGKIVNYSKSLLLFSK